MIIGYARVSSTGPEPRFATRRARQGGRREGLRREGERRPTDDRPGLAAALSHLREGDTLAVYSLSRLGRNTVALLQMTEDLQRRGIGFRSLTEGLDTGTTMGRFVITIMAGMAQMERELIAERRNAGIAAARGRGRNGGRPHRLTPKKIDALRAILAAPAAPSVGRSSGGAGRQQGNGIPRVGKERRIMSTNTPYLDVTGGRSLRGSFKAERSPKSALSRMMSLPRGREN